MVTAKPVAADVPGAGVWAKTMPAETVELDWATTANCSPTARSVAAAWAWVSPMTEGTVTVAAGESGEPAESGEVECAVPRPGAVEVLAYGDEEEPEAGRTEAGAEGEALAGAATEGEAEAPPRIAVAGEVEVEAEAS